MALWGAQACIAAYWVLAYQYADNDTGVAVRIARACLERGACASSGTPTSGFGLAHGAAWIRIIAYALATGGGLAAVQLIGLVSLVAATITWSIVAWRDLSWRAGMIASLLVLPLTMATLRYEDLTNGTLVPLPLALYYACTAWFVRSRRLPAALGASLFLAATVSSALGFVILVPLHVALVLLIAPRPFSAASAAALAVVVPFAIESSDAAMQIAHRIAWPSVVGGGLLFAVAALLVATPLRAVVAPVLARVGRWRARFLATPAPIRLRAAMKLTTIYLIAGPWIGLLVSRPLRVPAAHYFAPAVPPLVWLAADATEAMSRRSAAALIGILLLALAALLAAPLATSLGSVSCTLAAGAAFLIVLSRVARSRARLAAELDARPSPRLAVAGVALAALISVPDGLLLPRLRQVWPVATAETMARRLYDAGFTFPELMTALQGQAPYTIQPIVASLDPALFHDLVPPRDSTLSLLAVIVDPAIAARTRDVVARLDGPGRRTALAVRSVSVLDRARLRTCRTASCDDAVDPGRCTTRDPGAVVQHDRPYFPVAERESPAAAMLPSDQPRGGAYCVRFFVPLRMSGSGEPHTLRVANVWPLAIRIRSVSGVAFAGTVPGPEVRLPNDRVGTGTLEVEVAAHGVGPESDWLEEPPVIEVTPANEHLLAPFREGRVTLR